MSNQTNNIAAEVRHQKALTAKELANDFRMNALKDVDRTRTRAQRHQERDGVGVFAPIFANPGPNREARRKQEKLLRAGNHDPRPHAPAWPRVGEV